MQPIIISHRFHRTYTYKYAHIHTRTLALTRTRTHAYNIKFIRPIPDYITTIWISFTLNEITRKKSFSFLNISKYHLNYVCMLKRLWNHFMSFPSKSEKKKKRNCSNNNGSNYKYTLNRDFLFHWETIH